MNRNPAVESKAFGFLFISIAIAVLIGTIFNEFLSIHHVPIYYQLISWVMIFALILGITFTKMKNLFQTIRNRMKNSIKWPVQAKIINGLSWAGPFLMIPIFHSLTQYLILLGIGAGNISTYLLIRKYSKYDNKEQFVVGIIALSMISVLFFVDVVLESVVVQHHVLALSRIFVALSYGIGGVYALIEKP